MIKGRCKEPFNPPVVDHLVELVKPKDVGTVAKKVEKAVRRSSRLQDKQARTILTAMQNNSSTTRNASKWNKLFKLAMWTVGTMFVPTHVIAESSVVMHPGETYLHDLGLVHELKPIPPAPNIEEQHHMTVDQLNSMMFPDIKNVCWHVKMIKKTSDTK
jgi:hypothetical protein